MDANRLTTAQKRMQTRMGTSMRQPTAMQREANLSGVGYNTKVTAIDRPVTNHGMSGIKIQNQGPGRQIYDRNYYLNLLKSKNNEIVGEINKMNMEIDVAARPNDRDDMRMSTVNRIQTMMDSLKRYEQLLADKEEQVHFDADAVKDCQAIREDIE